MPAWSRTVRLRRISGNRRWNTTCDARGHNQHLQESFMNNGAHVGSSVVIKGELSAKEDIRIAGRVEGRVDVDGYTVTLEESGESTPTCLPRALPSPAR